MKVLNDYHADLRIDLKDSATVWSNTELTRCVERAVADLTRFRPLEKSAEFIVDVEIAAESFTSPAATDPDYFVDNEDISASVDGATCTLAASTPDVPRPVLITVTDANTSITDLVIIVKGRDVDGNYIEEYFYLAGGLVQTGLRYFATVTEVEIHEIDGNGVDDKLDVGTGSHLEVFVQLSNKPIKFHSDSITGYTRYTGYIVDYRGGRVALKTGTTMAAATAYSIKYTKDKVTIDISSLKDLVRVDRVEYPEGSVPQYLSTIEVWGNFLTLTSSGAETQTETSDNEHILVHYLAQHQPPSVSSPGTYPSFLDVTIELAASAYALFIEALQYEQQAVTDFGEVRTTLGYIGIGGSSPTLVYKVVEDALADVEKYLDNNSEADAAGILKDITDDVAELRTKIIAAEGAIATFLGKVSTVDLDAATPDSAVESLKKGENKIDILNDGEQVPAHHADYTRAWTTIAAARTQAAMGYAQEAATRIDNLRTYIEQAAGYNRIVEGFLGKAQTGLNEVQGFIAEASLHEQTALNNLGLADRFRAEAVERRNEAWAIWASPPQYAPQYTLTQRSQPAT